MRGLDQRSVLITGAARGIGYATAQRFAECGAQVLMVDMADENDVKLDGALAERATYCRFDVTKPDAHREIEKLIADRNIDVLVNNAGITRDKVSWKLDIEAWNQVIAVNLTAVFQLSQLMARSLRERGVPGVILNAASVVAHYGNFGQANYVASKAGVIGLTKTMAKELGRKNIRVNAVAPGFIGTDMVAKMPDEVLAGMREKAPLGRIGDPSEIAAAYAFLASDDAKFITGTTLNVDGGLILG